MILVDILKSLYSPLNAFKQIIQKTDVKGPIIILIMVLIATSCRQYILGSKIYIKPDNEFVNLISPNFITSFLGGALINSSIDFFLVWILYTAIILVVTVTFREQIGSRRTLFIVLGYTYIVTVVSILISALLISTFPSIEFPISAWPPANENDTVLVEDYMATYWYPSLAFQVVFYVSFLMDIWIAGLCAISIRFLGELTWGKAIMFSAIAYFVTFILRGILV